MCVNMQKKELLITIRGTAQVEDCVTDLTALPTVPSPPPPRPCPALLRNANHQGLLVGRSADPTMSHFPEVCVQTMNTISV